MATNRAPLSADDPEMENGRHRSLDQPNDDMRQTDYSLMQFRMKS
jgi:hypothetical protein